MFFFRGSALQVFGQCGGTKCGLGFAKTIFWGKGFGKTSAEFSRPQKGVWGMNAGGLCFLKKLASLGFQKNEKNDKCDIHFYLISKEMQGVFSIAEVVDSVHNKEKHTILQIVPNGFDKFQLKSLKAVIDLINERGGKAFLDENGFDESFPRASGEDAELSYRLAKKGHTLVFAPRAVVYHTHPATFVHYLKVKFFRAYWRTRMYLKHPEKSVEDSYTPSTLKINFFPW